MRVRLSRATFIERISYYLIHVFTENDVFQIAIFIFATRLRRNVRFDRFRTAIVTKSEETYRFCKHFGVAA